MKKGILGLLLLVSSSAFAHEAGGILCQLAPGVAPKTIASRYSITLVDATEGAPFALYNVPPGTDMDSLEAKLESDVNIVWVEDDIGMDVPEGQKGSTLPAVGDRNLLYAANTRMLRQINWNRGLALLPTRGVRVAILDTGLSPYQPALMSKVDAQLNAIEDGMPAYDTPHMQDSNFDGRFDNMTGHGTMVAGIIDQISPTSRFVIVRVADSDGMASVWTVVKGLAFAVTSGARVANISLGTLNELPAMSEVLEWCESKNLVVCAALGNQGIRGACYPARVGKTISVGGLLPNNAKAPFSNWYGGCIVSAPATGIVSQDWNGKMGIWSGTSFATPMATAFVAEGLRLSQRPVSVGKIRTVFRNFGGDLDRYNPAYRGQLGRSLDYMQFITGFLRR